MQILGQHVGRLAPGAAGFDEHGPDREKEFGSYGPTPRDLLALAFHIALEYSRGPPCMIAKSATASICEEKSVLRVLSPDRKRSATAFTGCMVLFLLINVFAVNGALGLLSAQTENVLQHSWNVIRAKTIYDSWGVMKEALDYFQAPGSGPVYTEIFFHRGERFQYPPSSLFALQGMLSVAGPEHVRTDPQVLAPITINDIVGWIFLALTAGTVAALLEHRLHLRQLADDNLALRAVRIVAVAGFTLTFYPVVKAFTLGQIQVWLNGLFAIALLCWAVGRHVGSGVLMALISLVKPHYGLFLLWAALRQHWHFATAFAVTLSVGLAASIAVYGLSNHVDYARVLFALSRTGEVYYPNQSVNGVLNRLAGLIDPVHYDSLEFADLPPFNIWVYAGTVVTSVIVLASALFRPGGTIDDCRIHDFCIMGLSLTIASPVAWEHHYGITLGMFAVLFARLAEARSSLLLLAASYVLVSNFIPAANSFASTGLNVMQSYLLVAALVLLVLLHAQQPGWRWAFRMGR